jgi:4-amino-4-deoxy-L-arabinose transferase-like glycosyltransferase
MSLSRQSIRFASAHLLFIATSLAWFIWLAGERLIARDEGFYTIAARLLSEGQTLYADFFFPQGPASAVLLSHFFSLSSFSWDAARLWAALFSTGASACVWFYCVRCYSFIYGVVACLLLLGCNIYFAWLPTAQTYAPAAFFLLLSCVLILRDVSQRSNASLLFGGVCLAVAALSRLYLAALIAPLFLIVFSTARDGRIKASAHLLIGFVIPIAIFLTYYMQHLESLWFNLVGYHLIRSDASLFEALPQKLKIFKIVTGIASTAKFEANQISYLLWLLLATSATRFIKGRSISVWLVMTLSVLFLSLLPSPAYVQYFCLLAPFVVIAIVDDLAYLAKHTNFFKRRIIVAIPALVILGFYLHSIPEDIERYTRSGKGVIGIYNRQAASIWNTRYIRQVSRQLDIRTANRGQVFAYWPGFLLESKHLPLPGFENHFALRIANKLTQAEQEQFHVADSAHLQEMIESSELKGLLLDPRKTKQTMREQLQASGFYQEKSIRFPLVFLRSRRQVLEFQPSQWQDTSPGS